MSGLPDRGSNVAEPYKPTPLPGWIKDRELPFFAGLPSSRSGYRRASCDVRSTACLHRAERSVLLEAAIELWAGIGSERRAVRTARLHPEADR